MEIFLIESIKGFHIDGKYSVNMHGVCVCMLFRNAMKMKFDSVRSFLSYAKKREPFDPINFYKPQAYT